MAQALPLTVKDDNEAPAGTPYYAPSQVSGTKIHLSNPAHIAIFSTPPK